MNPIRYLRSIVALTQRELAMAAGTSQPTIAAYETGAKSPTLRTLNQLAGALGMEVVVKFVPRLSREDRRSLAFHRAIADIVLRDSALAISHAKQNLARLRDLHPHAGMLLRRWREWLELSPGQLVNRLLDPGLEAREMRQVSPFSGLLSAQDRVAILRQFRRDECQ